MLNTNFAMYGRNKICQCEQQQTVSKTTVKNEASDLFDDRDLLISKLLDEIARYKKHVKKQDEEKAVMEKKIDVLQDELSKKDLIIIRQTEALSLAAPSGNDIVKENVLRDMASTTLSYAKRKDESITILEKRFAEMQDELDATKKRCSELEQRDAANDAGSTPTAHNTVTQRQIKNQRKKEKEREKEEQLKNGKKPAKIGPPVGHTGHAREWDPDYEKDYALKACPDCNGPLTEKKDYYKSLIEIEENKLSEGWIHAHIYDYTKCGIIDSKPESMLDGTIIGNWPRLHDSQTPTRVRASLLRQLK